MLAGTVTTQVGAMSHLPGGAKLRMFFSPGDESEHRLGELRSPAQMGTLGLRGQCLFLRRHICSGDSIVPAEFILIEQAPGVSQTQRDPGQHGREHAPSPDISWHRISVKLLQLKPGELQTWRNAAVDQQEVLVGTPENAGEKGCGNGYPGGRRHFARDAKENVRVSRNRRHYQDGIDSGSS